MGLFLIITLSILASLFIFTYLDVVWGIIVVLKAFLPLVILFAFLFVVPTLLLFLALVGEVSSAVVIVYWIVEVALLRRLSYSSS